jgi:DNA-binding MarR family transcriptional regulator
MTANSKSAELVVRLWRQMYQTYTLLKRCEDQLLEGHGLTTEQYGVLSALDYFGGPTRITDIALWLERSTNSVSMIVDRMVKAGLIKRVRDRHDRRTVHVVITSKGDNALKPATVETLQVIDKIMLPLSLEEKNTLLNLLGTVKYELLVYLNPRTNLEEVKRKELQQAANLKEWVIEYGLPTAHQAKRQGGKKRKTI